MISVIIPVYCNSEEKRTYLVEALNSVKVQSFKDFEVIIIDDNSPFDIKDIVEDISRHQNVIYVRNEQNLRQAGARNLGVKMAKGKFIAFLDHDDIWNENKLEEQYKTITKDLDIGMVFSKLEMKIMPNSSLDILKINQDNIPIISDFLTLFKNGNYIISASGVMVKKQILEEIGLFDERYTSMDDFDAWLKIAENHKIVFIPKILASYRIYGNNTNLSVNMFHDSKLLFCLYLNKFKKENITFKMKMLLKLIKKALALGYYYLKKS